MDPPPLLLPFPFQIKSNINRQDDTCEIIYRFEEPQDIVEIRVAFYKGDERKRKLKVKVNWDVYEIVESSGETEDFETFEINTKDTTTLSLKAHGLYRDEWLSIIEVLFILHGIVQQSCLIQKKTRGVGTTVARSFSRENNTTSALPQQKEKSA